VSTFDGFLLGWLIILTGYVVWKGKTGPIGYTGATGVPGRDGPPGPMGMMPSDADIERVVRKVMEEM
jgi:hypothetical protein